MSTLFPIDPIRRAAYREQFDERAGPELCQQPIVVDHSKIANAVHVNFTEWVGLSEFERLGLDAQHMSRVLTTAVDVTHARQFSSPSTLSPQGRRE